MGFIQILVEKTIPVFTIVLIGYLYGKIRTLDTKLISEFLLNLILPCFAFISIIKTKFLFMDLLVSVSAPITITLAVGLCAFVYAKASRRQNNGGLYLSTMFSNTGNIGLPIVVLAYGETGAAITVIYMVVVGLLIFSLGVFIASKSLGLSSVFRQSVLYAMVLGIGCKGLNIQIPNYVQFPIEMVASISIPLLLLILGYNLNLLSVHFIGDALLASGLRMGLGFMISWFLFIHILGVSGVVGKVIVLISSMPTAVVVYPLAEKYDSNPSLVGSVIVVSTLLSIVSIPLIIWLFQ